MATLATALSLALWIVSLAIFFQVNRRNRRRRRLQGLELRPNCLLTRYPIAFIEGPKSLFRLFDHWNEIPQFLREHGYEVIVLEPTPRGNRGAALLEAIKDLSGKCHVIADSSCEKDLEYLASERHEKIASLTLIRNPKAKTRGESRGPLSARDLMPMQMAIEVFELPQNGKHQPRRWSDYISFILLLAHNGLGLMKRRQPIDPAETAEFTGHKSWDSESRFLDLAISLAERDLQWSD